MPTCAPGHLSPVTSAGVNLSPDTKQGVNMDTARVSSHGHILHGFNHSTPCQNHFTIFRSFTFALPTAKHILHKFTNSILNSTESTVKLNISRDNSNQEAAVCIINGVYLGNCGCVEKRIAASCPSNTSANLGAAGGSCIVCPVAVTPTPATVSPDRACLQLVQ